jgi:integrator complex subunit 1
LEKDDEKLTKLIRSIIFNLKNTTTQPLTTGNLQNKQQVQNQPQQPDLNYLMALNYAALKRPHLFTKQTSLVEYLCTNLLFTNKTLSNQLMPGQTSVLKSKSLQSIRGGPTSPQQNQLKIQPCICNLLNHIFENETNWPEIFIRAYVDDSLGDRSWVDNPQCEEFVENIKTAFKTRPIPFTVDTNNGSNFVNIDEQQIELTASGLLDLADKKSKVTPRYDSIRTEIEILLNDLIRNQLNSTEKSASQPVKRLLGQTIPVRPEPVSSGDSRNFLKLLQNICGLPEVRLIVLPKLETWLINPKLCNSAQDLLLAVCVNCVEGTQIDKEIISQIIKLKPKLKQQQHYYDSIREFIKLNPNNFEFLIQMTIINELNTLQQHSLQQQQQAQQQAQSKNQHFLSLLQTALSTDSASGSRIIALTMQKCLLQRNDDEYIRLLRILIRDTIRNSRQDFDFLKFTTQLLNDDLIKQFCLGVFNLNDVLNNSLLNISGGLCDFKQVQVRERYVNSICDLITVSILVAITPQVKDAYLRRQAESRDILTKYYMLMAQIQCDSVTWLQETVRNYQINPMELIRCLLKILFMIDKPEQCYTVDNWPSEQERATLFRVVSEIPVLSDTLHQVLIITKSLPDDMYLHMLRVEENLLKLAALVHIKDIYSLKLAKMDQFVQSLFDICMYKYQVPSTLVVSVLYWRAWQILLIAACLDPKGFGFTAWEQYPTLRMLMEMIMTDDYNYPPQSSITEEMNVEKFKTMEAQICTFEKQEILEFENSFEMKQGSIVRNEANSKLIGQIMKFDPM